MQIFLMPAIKNDIDIAKIKLSMYIAGPILFAGCVTVLLMSVGTGKFSQVLYLYFSCWRHRTRGRKINEVKRHLVNLPRYDNTVLLTYVRTYVKFLEKKELCKQQ